MKLKTLLLSILLLPLLSSYAQNSDHLTFKGIPIDGSLQTVIGKLVQNGFTRVYGEQSAVSGRFLNEDATVVVRTSDKTGNVYGITVGLEGSDKWSEFKAKIDNIATLFTKKYGEPSEVHSERDNESMTIGWEILFMKDGKFQYYYSWTAENGKISLHAVSSYDNEETIIINYVDSKNSELLVDDLLDEI